MLEPNRSGANRLRMPGMLTAAILLLFAPVSLPAMEMDTDPVRVKEAYIEELAAREDPFTLLLYPPLLDLAEEYRRLGDTELAIDTLRRAQHILHRNEGVYTLRQSDVLSRLIDISIAAGDYEEANLQEEFRHFIRTHDLEEGSRDMVIADMDLARWYLATGQPNRARRLLQPSIERALELDLDLLPLALDINRARRLAGNCCNYKELLAAIENAADQAPDKDLLVAAYLDLADVLLMARKSDRANQYFLLAAELDPQAVAATEPSPIQVKRTLKDPSNPSFRTYSIQTDPLQRRKLERMTEEEELEDRYREPQWFIVDDDQQLQPFEVPDSHEGFDRDRRTLERVGHPIMFSEEQLDNLLPYRLENQKHELEIEVEFTVTERGDLEDIEVIESNAPRKLNRLVTESLRRTYFRPALVAGQPVRREHVRLRQTFGSREAQS